MSVFGVTAWMTYDGVFSDIAPIQAQAEQAACTVKKCKDQHGMTKLDRTPFGQSFQFTWQDGLVAIDCHREFYVAGSRKCAPP
jgi:hypothetical protein